MLASQQCLRRSVQQLSRHLQPALAELACCEHVGFSGRAASSGAAAQEEPKPVQAEIKRMMYRARQRGHLELDLLVGLWAEEHVPNLGHAQLSQLQTLLECENPDLFGWLTGQKDYPPELNENSAFQSMRQDVQAKLAAHRPQSAASSEGKQWVRGWDDAWRDKSSESAEVPATGDHIPK